MDGHLVLDHSVFEEVDTGHNVKSHANRLDANCSVMASGTTEAYSGSQALDLDGGGGQVTINNSLAIGGLYFYDAKNANSPWFIEFGGDKTAWDGDQTSQFLVFNNSYVINDRGQFMAGLHAPMQPSQPYAWNNNIFIGSWDDGFTSVPCGGSIPCEMPASRLNDPNSPGRLADVNFGCPASSDKLGQDCRSLRDTGNPSTTGNLFFSTRAQARAHNWPSAASPIKDLPTRTDFGGTTYTAFPFDPNLYPMPPACAGQPIGNVQWPL
jgi:hypothetical protein